MSDPIHSVAKGLASAFLAGDWEPTMMTRRGQRAVGQRRVWVRDLALAARHAYPSAPLDRPRELASFLAACPPFIGAFASARARSEPAPSVKRWFFAPTVMGEQPWPVTPLPTVRDLQDLLGLSLSDLLWFADPKQLERAVGDEALRHYRYRWATKRGGGARLIEAPKPMLKHFQRVVLREILDHIPPHPAAHGFHTGRSAVTYAAGHTRQQVVIHIDLEDFFPSIAAGRVFGIFRRCGYPEPVAHLLTGLVTNSVPHRVRSLAPRPGAPESVLAGRRLLHHLAQQHLPQGAPTSPALANLVAFNIDRRLAGLAGETGLTYSRYADDLALSSPTRRRADEVTRLIALVTRVATEEGFRVNASKTSVRRAAQRQRLAGVVINERPNVERGEYDRLKAIIHNSARYGPTSQNRENHPHFRAHLLGRVGWVGHLNPRRGERLLAAFSRVDWSEPSR